jgi:RHS repeat-associated protein
VTNVVLLVAVLVSQTDGPPFSPGSVTDTELGPSSSGSAVHSIPLDLPQGLGPSPRIGIAYDSSIGSGIAGVGWSLSGFPAIVRLPARAYGGADRFAFAPMGAQAGREPAARDALVVVPALGPDTFLEARQGPGPLRKFTAHGRCGVGPCGWTMRDGLGTEYRFGASDVVDHSYHSTLWERTADLGIDVWALEEIIDSEGRRLRVEYTNDRITLRPVSVWYNQHDETRSGYRVDLVYEARDDRVPEPFPHTVRLASVQVHGKCLQGSCVLLREFTLSYLGSPVSGRSLLRAVRHVADGVSEHIASFDYSGESPVEPLTTLLPTAALKASGESFLDIDVTGDGRTDRVFIRDNEDDGRQISMIRGTNAGWSTVREGPGGPLPTNAGHLVHHYTYGDFNADGFMDLVGAAVDPSGTFIDHPVGQRKLSVLVALGSPEGYTTMLRQDTPFVSLDDDADIVANSVASGDFNGDGRDDLVLRFVSRPEPEDDEGEVSLHEHHAYLISTGQPSPAVFAAPVILSNRSAPLWPRHDMRVPLAESGYNFGSVRLFARDFDRDGYCDLVWMAVTTSGVVVFSGFGGPTGITQHGAQLLGVPGKPFGPVLGDFDGDQRLDLAGEIPTAQWDVTSGFLLRATPSRTWSLQLASFTNTAGGVGAAVDVDGDGRTDFANGMRVLRIARGLGAAWEDLPSDPRVPHPLWADVNGDSLLDFVGNELAPDAGNVREYTGNAASTWLHYDPPRSRNPCLWGQAGGGGSVADINGDGLLDVEGHSLILGVGSVVNASPCQANPSLHVSGGASTEWLFYFHLRLSKAADSPISPIPDLLISVSRGDTWGAPLSKVSLTYKPSTSWPRAVRPTDTDCLAGAGVAAPSASCGILDSAVHVLLESVTTRIGSGPAERMWFDYEEARVMRGPAALRGRLGFGRVSTTRDSGVTTQTDYAQAWPFTGATRATSVFDTSGRVVSAQSATYEAREIYPGVFARLPVASTSSRYEAGSAIAASSQTTEYGTGQRATFPVVQRSWVDYSVVPRDTAATDDAFVRRVEYAPVVADAWLTALVSGTVSYRENRTTRAPTAWLAADRIQYDVTHPSRPVAMSRLLLASSYGTCGATPTTEACRAYILARPDEGRWVDVVSSTSYDDFGRLISWSGPPTPSGVRTTELAYEDDYGARVSDTWNALRHHASLKYDQEGRVVESTDVNGQTTAYRRDAFGRVLGIKMPGDVSESYFASPRTEVACPSDPLARCWLYSEARATSPSQITWTDVYADDAGRIERVQQPFRRTTRSGVVEESGTVIQTVERGIDGATGDRFERHAFPQFQPGSQGVSSWSSPLRVERRMDALGRARSSRILDPSGATTSLEQWSYELDGSVVVTDGDGRQQKTYFDALGNPLIVLDPDDGEAVYSRDPAGNVEEVVVPAGTMPRHKSFAYDSWGRITDASDNVRWTYAYDDTSNLIKETVTDALGAASAFVVARGYDILGRVVSEGAPSGVPDVRYFYDETNPGSANYGTGRLSRVIDGTGSYQHGSLTGAWREASSLFGYDRRGRLNYRAVAATGISGAHVFRYGYDMQDRLTRLELPGSPGSTTAGPIREYLYASTGALAEVTQGTTTVAKFSQFDAMMQPHRATRNLVGSTWSNTESFEYDARARLTQWRVAAADGHAVLSDTYGYTNASRLESIVDGRTLRTFTDGATSIPTTRAAFYGYSSSGRLEFADVGADPRRQYGYDDQGSLSSDGERQISATTCAPAVALETCFALRTPQGVSLGGFRNNAVGLRVSETRGATTFGFDYDRWRRLVGIRRGTTTTPLDSYAYAFDGSIRKQVHTEAGSSVTTWGLGDGVEIRSVSTAPTSYVMTYDVDGMALISSGTATGQPTMAHVRSRARRIYSGSSDQIPPAGTVLVYRDRLGSAVLTTLATNATGAADGTEASTYAYDPWGALLSARSSGHDVVRRKYTGHIQNAATGFHLTVTRAYDPNSRRFTSADDIIVGASPIGYNRYAYVTGDPINSWDPVREEWF